MEKNLSRKTHIKPNPHNPKDKPKNFVAFFDRKWYDVREI
jgi:hypothetical protein